MSWPDESPAFFSRGRSTAKLEGARLDPLEQAIQTLGLVDETKTDVIG